MAGKGNSRYLKRLNAPRYFGVHRKENAYVTKPNPGRHTLDKCVPLSLAAIKLSIAHNNREAFKVIKTGAVAVNGKAIKEPKYPVGMEDHISGGGETYKIGVNRQGKVQFSKVPKSEGAMLYKVIGKYKERGKRTMLRLHDGSVIEANQEIAVNDSVVVRNNAIEKRLKLEPGASCSVIDGVHVGTRGKIGSIIPGSMHKQKSLVVEGESGRLETLVGNIMVTG
jgi:small subunit ribosomal protein S4e